MRSTQEVVDSHLQLRKDGALEEDITNNYADDVILLTGTGMFTGHDGVRKSASELDRYLGESDFQYQNVLCEREYGFLEWTATNKDKQVRDGADSFVVRDGKIIFQSIHYTVNRK